MKYYYLINSKYRTNSCQFTYKICSQHWRLNNKNFTWGILTRESGIQTARCLYFLVYTYIDALWSTSWSALVSSLCLDDIFFVLSFLSLFCLWIFLVIGSLGFYYSSELLREAYLSLISKFYSAILILGFMNNLINI